MPKEPTTAKKHQAEQGPFASRDATHKVVPSPRGGKQRASRSQNQASKRSKRKSHLQKSTNFRSKEAIDLTGDNSDAPVARSQRANVKPQHQLTTKKKRTRSDQHLTNQPSTPTLTSPSLASGDTIHSISGMATLDQTVSPPDRAAKRARCEDGINMERDVTIPSVEHYNMVPPQTSFLDLTSATALDDHGTKHNCVQDRVHSPDVKTTQAYHQLEANPTKSTPKESVTAKTSPPPNSNEGVTLVQSMPNRTDCKVMPKPEQKAKVETHPTQQNSKSLPTLMEKINSAREFSVALGIAERDAYQQLMTYDWDVDQAVLAYLSGAARMKAEDADAIAANADNVDLNSKTSDRNINQCG